MICEICKKSQAKIHVTQFKEGEKISVHLCQECAHEKGLAGPSINTHFSVADLLAGLLKTTGEEAAAAPEPAMTCPSCGLSYRGFKESGRFGCAECYETFGDELIPLLQKIQKGTDHSGKIPRRGTEASPERTISALRLRLKEAVRTEDYEEAARLRDEIKALEQEMNASGSNAGGDS